MAKVVFTRDFTACLRTLSRAGGHGTRAVQRARACATEAQTEGKITTAPRTHHGESRLPDVEKYDLGNGQRLVVQLVNSKDNVRAFLFAGDHEDTEAWLENHRDHRWVKRDSDETLEFVQITPQKAPPKPPPVPDLETPEALLSLPLLRDLGPGQWAALGLNPKVQAYVAGINSDRWEGDAVGVVEHIERIANTALACLFLDLFELAHQRKWDALLARIDLHAGAAKITAGPEAAAAMTDLANSELFVTWDEAETVPDAADWADWMLFLHPEQRKLVQQSFSGPARLRGVSGSGKTCVLLHRARALALKHRHPVLIITLTASTQKLLRQLLDRLCGVERSLINVSTVAAVAHGIIATANAVSSSRVAESLVRSLEEQVLSHIVNHMAFPTSPLKGFDPGRLRAYVIDEVAYIRRRLRPQNYDYYLSSLFQRRGRGVPLTATFRQMFLEAARMWDQKLLAARAMDAESLMAAALDVVEKGTPEASYRAILVDEVQDLSEVEVALLSRLQTPDGPMVKDVENGLFLVGDGAQTIYKKGFSLRSAGINVSGRSFVLQKNYRNTREILEAAFGLISIYEFADIDEDNIAAPTPPHYAKRHGEKPYLIKCPRYIDQAVLVAGYVRERINDGTTPGQICIIGFSATMRADMRVALDHAGIPSIELRDDVDFESPRVKISTVESAKGHEFSTVFVVGLNRGAMPAAHAEEHDEIPREAARLYVAMTRAKDELFMSYVLGDGVQVSEFLLAIQDKCQEAAFFGDTLRPIETE